MSPLPRQLLADVREDSPSDRIEPVALENSANDTVHSASLVEHPAGAEAVDSPSSQFPDCPEGARLIPLTRGYFAIVDADDYERVARLRWQAYSRPGRKVYARTGWKAGGRWHGAKLHRFILDAPPGLMVDHVNGNGLDNRRCNLRLCTTRENNWNFPAHRDALVSFKGVSPLGNKFYARISVDGRSIHLGVFTTSEDAARAYDTAAKQFHGPFARLNFSDGNNVSHATNDACGETRCVAGEKTP